MTLYKCIMIYNYYYISTAVKVFCALPIHPSLPNPQGIPGGTSGKELACQHRRHKRHGFDPWVGEIPLEEGMIIHSSILPRESHDRGT